MTQELMIECENLVKIYRTKEIEVMALQGLDMAIEKGELTAIIGNSGSGKSTLLNMLGGLVKPSAGRLIVDGINLNKIKKGELQKYLLHTVGFVWQNNARNLLPYLTARENVELPMLLSNSKKRKERALELLERVGMSHRINSRLGELSGGEQQRIAIAIALANKPQLLLADEPTGAVDSYNTHRIMEVFRKVNEEEKVTVLIVTHDHELSKMVNRVINIRDGRTSSEFLVKDSYLNQLKALERYDKETIADTHEEFVVLDKVGRLQLPKDIVESLQLARKDRLKVYLEDGRIVMEKRLENEELL